MKSLLFELRKIYSVVICSFLCFDAFCMIISRDQYKKMVTAVPGLKERMEDSDVIKIINIIGGIYVGLFLYALWLLYESLIHRWLNNFLF